MRPRRPAGLPSRRPGPRLLAIRRTDSYHNGGASATASAVPPGLVAIATEVGRSGRFRARRAVDHVQEDAEAGVARLRRAGERMAGRPPPGAAHRDPARGGVAGVVDVAPEQAPAPSEGAAIGLEEAGHSHRL